MTPRFLYAPNDLKPHSVGSEIRSALESIGEIRLVKTTGEITPGAGTLLLLGSQLPRPEELNPAPGDCLVVIMEPGDTAPPATTRHWLARANLVACANEVTWHSREDIFRVPLGHKVVPLPPKIEHFDLEEYRQVAREILELPADEPVVLFESDGTEAGWSAARFVVETLAEEIPHAIFLILGGSPARKTAKNIRTVEGSSMEVRKVLLAAADLVVAPYIKKPHDGTARTMEYLLGGIPLLATREAIHPEMIESGGVVTSQLDDFAVDAAWLLGSGEERSRLIERGRKAAMELAAPPYRYTDLLRSIQLKETRRLLILNDHRVTPALQGGQVRVEAVCRALAREGVGVTLISISNEERGSRSLLDIHFEEMTLPRGRKLQALDRRLEQIAGANASDVSTLLGAAKHIPGGRETMKRELLHAGAVLFVHPYMSGYLGLVPEATPVLFDSLNTEWKLKEAIFPRRLGRMFLTRVVRRAEARMLRRASSTYYVSAENQGEMGQLARTRGKGSYICPNGVTVKGRDWLDPTDRVPMRREYGLPENPMAVFLGSGHPPNAEAAGFIIDTLAPAFPNVTFVLIGTVIGWFHGQNLPTNVLPWGAASTPVKNALLSVSDIGLNPMMTGSGTSLKMMDYMASGLPILTTEIGARGMTGPELEGALLTPLDKFPEELAGLLENVLLRHDLSRSARKTAENHFDWDITLGEMVADIKRRINP